MEGNDLSKRLKEIDEFFDNPENLKLIDENKKYSREVSEYIRKNIEIDPEILYEPFM
jgi:hypothetical protein